MPSHALRNGYARGVFTDPEVFADMLTSRLQGGVLTG